MEHARDFCRFISPPGHRLSHLTSPKGGPILSLNRSFGGQRSAHTLVARRQCVNWEHTLEPLARSRLFPTGALPLRGDEASALHRPSKIFIALRDCDELALSCSRGSPTSFPSPLECCMRAAMSVQYRALIAKPTPYIVLYCLTPRQFGRYSSLTLCPPCPAWGEDAAQAGPCAERKRHPMREGNLPGKYQRRQLNRPAASYCNRQLFLRSSRCSN